MHTHTHTFYKCVLCNNSQRKSGKHLENEGTWEGFKVRYSGRNAERKGRGEDVIIF